MIKAQLNLFYGKNDKECLARKAYIMNILRWIICIKNEVLKS